MIALRRLVVALPPPPSEKRQSVGGPVSLWLLLSLSQLAVAGGSNPRDSDKLELQQIGAAGYHWIAARIFENETRGQTKYLTYWGAGEDFPSLGIGHFIWFPKGVDAPFDESFPAMVGHVSERTGDCAPLPDWLQSLKSFDAPWNSKEAFDQLQQSERMIALREWLTATALEQAQYIVTSFTERWNRLGLPGSEKARMTAILQRLVQSSQGMYAVIDYTNFKGLGSNPRERYKGEGWGLVQVIGDLAGDIAAGQDGKGEAQKGEGQLLDRFSKAAANRLTMRVHNSPPERNEARWLEGWLKRVAEYTGAGYTGAGYTGSVPALVGQRQSAFRVTPYVQSPSRTGMTLVWFSGQATPGRVTIHRATAQSGATPEEDTREMTSIPTRACDLAYHLAEYRDLEAAKSIPYKHEIAVEALVAGGTYRYQVEQDGESVTGEFRTPGMPDQGVKFIVYADSETEPESTGKHALWPAPGGSGMESRHYPVDQTSGYAANLDAIYARRPDFVAIAGDLVESGGEQRDWDEFWRHNAMLAASTPIMPALGNHDYYGGPGDLGGYGNHASRRAIKKYRTYFDAAPYYSVDYGPLTLVVVDGNNGVPERSASDTNWFLSGEGEGGIAPALNPLSSQMRWLKRTLSAAQKDKQFTFVMFHASPYTSGIHGKPPGLDPANNFASGMPLRALTPMFLRYGVDAVFNGHDEMYEHSVVHGAEQHPDGSQSDHRVHFFTVGIGGDGLRGPAVDNAQRVFLAHLDAPEVYGTDGLLQSGGKHYGHVEVSVTDAGDGYWQARIEPVYIIPVWNKDGQVDSFERRVYDDVLLLENSRDS